MTPSPTEEVRVEFAHGQQGIQSRLEQWGAGIGLDPSRGFGFDRREQASGWPDGDAEIGRGASDGTLTSRERKTAAGHRLISAAKVRGFFLDDADKSYVYPETLKHRIESDSEYDFYAF
jgi:hypothetical protein